MKKEIMMFIKSHESRFHSWLPLNLSVWYVLEVKAIEVSLNIGGRKVKTSVAEIYD